MNQKLISIIVGSFVFASLGISLVPGQTADFDKEKVNHWHQWRGPNFDGVAPKADPPTQWDAETNIKWKVKMVGEGISTPIVWKNRIYLVSAVDTKKAPDESVKRDPRTMTVPPNAIFEFAVWCFDLESGKQIWKKVAKRAAPHEGRHKSSTYAAASPMTDGKHLLVSFGSYGIFCYNLDGKLLWERQLGKMRTRRGWGEAVSPVIHGDKAIVMWDQEDQSKIFVLNLADGKTIWEKQRDEPTTWATPLVVNHDGKDQLITNGTTQLRSYDLENGKVIWQTSGTTLNAIPCPILFEKNVICMAGYRGNRAVSVSLNSKGNVASDKVTWEIRRGTPYVPSPLLSESRLYFTQHLISALNCVDAKTGKPMYETVRIPGLRNVYASPIAASGRVYLPGRDGTTVVFKDSDKFELLSTNKLEDPIDASPVAVGKKLLLRGRKFLYCIEDSK